MDLWQLRVFVNVVEQKSFSKAGEAIFLSQPTVSSHIKELEEHFRCRLIDRLGKEAIPTKAGEMLYGYAKELLYLKANAEAGISLFLEDAKGDLTIGGSSIPSTYIIPKIIGSFTKKYPNISLSVMTGDTSEITDAILNGKIEAGVVGAKIKSVEDRATLNQEMLIDDEMRLIVPSSHRWADKESIDIKSLLKEPFIGRERGSGTWDSISKSLSKFNHTCESLNISVRLGSNASVMQGVLNGAGVSIISTIAVQDYIDSGRLKALSVDGLELKRNFFITTNSKRTLSPLAKIFIDFIKTALQS
ncbi:MAG: LysR family transcriptional regulator [Desulfamplus sp.]|nr:LysR family transcriptional regulator [Desulfamplus sp.]